MGKNEFAPAEDARDGASQALFLRKLNVEERFGLGNNSTTIETAFASLKPFLKKYLEKSL